MYNEEDTKMWEQMWNTYGSSSLGMGQLTHFIDYNRFNLSSWMLIHNGWRPEFELIAKKKNIDYNSSSDKYFTNIQSSVDQSLLEETMNEAIKLKKSYKSLLEETWMPQKDDIVKFPVGTEVHIPHKDAFGTVTIVDHSCKPVLYGVDTGYFSSSGTYREDELADAFHFWVPGKSGAWHTEVKKTKEPEKLSKGLATTGIALWLLLASVIGYKAVLDAPALWENFVTYITSFSWYF